MIYDIIADVHGEGERLHLLLKKLGYSRRGSVFSQPGHQAVFLGDLIDRGPQEKMALTTVMAMHESGAALCILGNHEYNAVTWDAVNPLTGSHYRSHSIKHRQQHEAYLREIGNDTAFNQRVIQWFQTLPFTVTVGGLICVHACPDQLSLDMLSKACPEMVFSKNNRRFFTECATRGTVLGQALARVICGIEFPAPDGRSFMDPYGQLRTECRMRWWAKHPKTYGEASFPEDIKNPLWSLPISDPSILPPVSWNTSFLVACGHYDLPYRSRPFALSARCTSIDFGVASGGPLVSYRYEGEDVFINSHFSWV